jgi:hypothetical protein
MANGAATTAQRTAHTVTSIIDADNTHRLTGTIQTVALNPRQLAPQR